MITRNALYDFVDALIEAAPQSSPLSDARSFRSLRGSIDDAVRIVRVEVTEGYHALSSDPKLKELRVQAVIQCWVLPEDDSEAALDDATDESFEMSRAIFEAVAQSSHLSGKVCDTDFQQFETGYANLGSIRRGVTYLDGVINQAS